MSGTSIMGINTGRLKSDPDYWDAVAPNTATHFNPELNAWCHRSMGEHCIPRPKSHPNDTQPLGPEPQVPAEWGGEGLPPVGSTQRNCELVGIHGDTGQFEVVAHRNGAAIVYVPLDDNDGDAFPALPCHFRPVRTQAEPEDPEWGGYRSRRSRDPVPRPTKPAAPDWDGTCLPPVGCKCEMLHPGIPGGSWQTVVIKAHFDNRIVIKGDKKIWEKSGYGIIVIDNELEFRALKVKDESDREEVITNALSYVPLPESSEISRRQYLIDSLNFIYDADMLRKGDS